MWIFSNNNTQILILSHVCCKHDCSCFCQALYFQITFAFNFSCSPLILTLFCTNVRCVSLALCFVLYMFVSSTIFNAVMSYSIIIMFYVHKNVRLLLRMVFFCFVSFLTAIQKILYKVVVFVIALRKIGERPAQISPTSRSFKDVHPYVNNLKICSRLSILKWQWLLSV